MSDNLDFILTSSTILNPTTSDVSEVTLLDVPTETNLSHSAWVADPNNVTIAELDSIKSYTEPGATATDYEGNNHKCGVYYNFYTATAKTGNYYATQNPSSSLCPKGWKIPSNVNMRFLVYDSYHLVNDTQLSYDQIRTRPLTYIPNGVYRDGGDGGILSARGRNGYYWNSDMNPADHFTGYESHFALPTASRGYLFRAATSTVRWRGVSIRCVNR